MRHAPAPIDEADLLVRARTLAGHTLAWLAGQLQAPVPPDLTRHKGWVGHLLEAALGTSAGSRSEPDFPHLGIELKTLPVREDGRVQQSTWVCHAPLERSLGPDWLHSDVRAKLSRVLWIPVVGAGVLGERRVGTPLLWSPDAEQEATLRQDWEQHADRLRRGALSEVHARHGVALQLRPKAAHRGEWVWVVDEEGDWAQANPVGFYLRRTFTQSLVDRAFGR